MPLEEQYEKALRAWLSFRPSVAEAEAELGLSGVEAKTHKTMNAKTTNAKTLIIRCLSPEVNRALRWGKRRFGQATNSKAAERMLLRCRVQEECIKGLELEKRELERRCRELLRAARRLAELQGELEEAKGDLRVLLSELPGDQPGAGESGPLRH
ncbi:MAG: hypothetical protein KDD28_03775 [Phaeodactylibacter sp.]|nr:hypothetical protein [Phaeodactylibacter sp.]